MDVRPVQAVAPHGAHFNAALFWVNYWSDATMKRFGLPDKEFEATFAGLFERAYRGWIVRLAKRHPDLASTADRERIEWLYRRIGAASP